MENAAYELTSAEKKSKFFRELKDLLQGTAFPFMLQVIFGTTIIMFSGTSERALGIVVLVIGELFLIASYLMFGRQNGITAARRTCKNSKKRELGSADSEVVYKTGEYALYKGIIIGLLSCVPYIIVQLVNCVAANSFCELLLSYAFGWAYYPLYLAEASQWLNFIWIIPLVGVHVGGYLWGAKLEFKRQAKIAEINDADKNKRRKK